MSKKVFISYSHKDEAYKDSLEEHLSLLKNNNIISVWHDRKISAGDDWKEQLDENLESADIVIFLVSSSFLASKYCTDIEVRKAIKKHEEGSAIIFSIIVRPCDWEGGNFSRFQSLPKNLKPISTWKNKDSGWVDAINGLKESIQKYNFPSAVISEPSKKNFKLTDEQLKWLVDTDVDFSTRKYGKINLDDIYVVPDIYFKDEANKESDDIECLNLILNEKNHFLLSGEEQQGKTSSLKYLFKEFLKKGLLPIYVDAKNISNSDPNSFVNKELSKQYSNLSFDEFDVFLDKVLLLDNFSSIGLNEKFQNVFIESISKKYDWVVVTCDSSFSYISSELPAFSKYREAKILGFGNSKREILVKKWVSLGVEESISDIDLYSEIDGLKNQINIVIKKNIVPPKPIYILIMMQMLDANTQRSLELTSYGHCYQYLIYQAFEKAKIDARNQEKYLNVLTELSWAIFKNKGGLNEFKLNYFFNDYGGKYLSVDKNDVIEKLICNSILTRNNGVVDFKYPYIYYFFMGKKIAEGFLECEDVKYEVDYLLENLYKEDCANILIFITHHTKNSWVLTKINEVLMNLFQDQPRAVLRKDQLLFMDSFVRLIPELVLEKREIQKERDKHNKRLDEIERKKESVHDYSVDLLSNVTKTFRGMEIAGQIIRNRHATMTRESIANLADNGISAGLRFLEFFINISDSSKKEIIDIIEKHLEEHPTLSSKKIIDYAEKIYLHLTYDVISAVVRKIASSVGSREAVEIYNALEEKEKTPAFILINQSIEFQFERILNIDSVRSTAEKLKNNPVCLRILKEMVIQHIYMFPVEYKKKQQLSELLKISVQDQRLMDQKKLGKG